MTCSILISELGLMTEVLNTCMEILTFLVKRKEKKTKLISWHLELFYMCQFKKVNEISQNSSGRGGPLRMTYILWTSVLRVFAESFNHTKIPWSNLSFTWPPESGFLSHHTQWDNCYTLLCKTTTQKAILATSQC